MKLHTYVVLSLLLLMGIAFEKLDLEIPVTPTVIVQPVERKKKSSPKTSDAADEEK